jgi:hypothetical protein
MATNKMITYIAGGCIIDMNHEQAVRWDEGNLENIEIDRLLCCVPGADNGLDLNITVRDALDAGHCDEYDLMDGIDWNNQG